MRKLILAATAATTLITPAIASANLNAHGPAKVPVHACVAKRGHKARLAKHCTRNERGITIWLKAIPGPQGPQGVQGPAGTNGTNGTTGTVGTESINGMNVATGPQGPAGVSSPWTWSYTGGHSQDTAVGGDVWANDTYNTQFWVIPQGDGTYLVEKQLVGHFTTIAGAPTPNTGKGSLTGGITGTLNAVESFTVYTDTSTNTSGLPNGGYFDPTATPNLNGMSSNAQNYAFLQAFFPGATVAPGHIDTTTDPSNPVLWVDHYDFVYHTSDGSQTMVQADNNYSGDITG